MKNLIFIAVFLSILESFAQNKLVDKTGSITFEASVPSFEEVKAKNETVSFVLYPSNGEISGLALIKGFKFKIPMMEEHFNEVYMESDSYPKATFKGKIENFDISKLTAAPQNYTVNGKMKMHGKSKKITITASIKKTTNGVEIKADFSLNSDDFKIMIPDVVSKKVSKNVLVKLNTKLKAND